MKSPVMWYGSEAEFDGKLVGRITKRHEKRDDGSDPPDPYLLVFYSDESRLCSEPEDSVRLTGWAKVAIPQAERIIEDRMGWKRPNGEQPPTVPM